MRCSYCGRQLESPRINYRSSALIEEDEDGVAVAASLLTFMYNCECCNIMTCSEYSGASLDVEDIYTDEDDLESNDS